MKTFRLFISGKALDMPDYEDVTRAEDKLAAAYYFAAKLKWGGWDDGVLMPYIEEVDIAELKAMVDEQLIK